MLVDPKQGTPPTAMAEALARAMHKAKVVHLVTDEGENHQKVLTNRGQEVVFLKNVCLSFPHLKRPE